MVDVRHSGRYEGEDLLGRQRGIGRLLQQIYTRGVGLMLAVVGGGERTLETGEVAVGLSARKFLVGYCCTSYEERRGVHRGRRPISEEGDCLSVLRERGGYAMFAKG